MTKEEVKETENKIILFHGLWVAFSIFSLIFYLFLPSVIDIHVSKFLDLFMLITGFCVFCFSLYCLYKWLSLAVLVVINKN
jgi:hypothetical protein